MANAVLTDFDPSGQGRGLFGVFRHRYLLQLLVRKELKVRYRRSVLGLLWSYVKPAVQFAVYFVAIGMFLGLNETMDNFAVYLFSGIIVMNFFTEAVRNATRSIIDNAALIKKIYLPRELFPVASVYVSAVHFLPQVVVLCVAMPFFGWRWDPTGILMVFIGFVLLLVLSIGLGLLFGALNVIFRDAENFVDLINMVITWSAPVLYTAVLVRDTLGETAFAFYQANPLVVIVELFHRGFWAPTVSHGVELAGQPLAQWLSITAATCIAVFVVGQLVFTKVSKRFAQEL